MKPSEAKGDAHMNRRYFWLAATALILSACGAQRATPPVALANDKPTLLYFWTPY